MHTQILIMNISLTKVLWSYLWSTIVWWVNIVSSKEEKPFLRHFIKIESLFKILNKKYNLKQFNIFPVYTGSPEIKIKFVGIYAALFNKHCSILQVNETILNGKYVHEEIHALGSLFGILLLLKKMWHKETDATLCSVLEKQHAYFICM